MRFNGRGETKYCTEADLLNAQLIAWRLYKPEPYQRNTSKPHPPGMTLEQIAQELGITREGVRQIEVRAMAKCRQWADANGYTLEDMLAMLGR